MEFIDKIHSRRAPQMPQISHFPQSLGARFASAVAATAVVLSLAGPLGAQQQGQQAPKVTIAAAAARDIVQHASFIGRAEAIDKVDVMARVNGFLEETLIRDGAEVGQGDLLFRIEDSNYAAILEARQATLAKAEASLRLASLELARKTELFERGSVPEAERDSARANELVAEAEVRSARAAIRQAELDLSYTRIHAPFPGRVGRIQVSTGDVVAPGGAALVSLVREAPIYVAFSLNEKQFIDIMEELGTDPEGMSRDENRPDVHVTLPNGSVLDETGEIVFLDNRIDPATGSITLRAQFPNAKRLLVDGAFVQVSIEAPRAVSRIVIPQAALQRDQKGDFVLIVGAQQTVEQRHVTTGEQIGTEIVITDGLLAGESVIVEGLQRVRPGLAVNAVLATVED
jgi:membrane fusion protein (multidrug efflux system)